MTSREDLATTVVVVVGVTLLAAMAVYLIVAWATRQPDVTVTAGVFGVLVTIVIGAVAILIQYLHRRKRSQ